MFVRKRVDCWISRSSVASAETEDGDLRVILASRSQPVQWLTRCARETRSSDRGDSQSRADSCGRLAFGLCRFAIEILSRDHEFAERVQIAAHDG